MRFISLSWLDDCPPRSALIKVGHPQKRTFIEWLRGREPLPDREEHYVGYSRTWTRLSDGSRFDCFSGMSGWLREQYWHCSDDATSLRLTAQAREFLKKQKQN